MILPIVQYGHPALRQKGESIERITPEVRQLVTDMLDTMYDAHGIGLAAHQVGHAVRLTVLDVRGLKDRPSTLEIDGRAADIEERMPMVLINPELTLVGDTVNGPEGCLSFPEIYADIPRAARIDVHALGADGRPVAFRCGGLLARAIQHEVDHLNGVLFIDRMSRETKAELKETLAGLMEETKASLKADPTPAPAAKGRRAASEKNSGKPASKSLR
ncbi:MAG: peptide deformylase [Verrucomicrobiae bacterium]|nr:peptide deformylase [Verrucomicrobiae bacterium]